MKKLLSIAMLFVAGSVFAQENIETYGLGAPEYHKSAKDAPSNPVFNENDYKVLKSQDYVAVKMDNDQFCKNVTIIRDENQGGKMEFNKDNFFKAGPLMVVTDRILEDNAFYSYSPEMLEVFNKPQEWREIYKGSSEGMRGANHRNSYYYNTAYSHYNSNELVNILSQSLSSTEVTLPKNAYAIPSKTTTTKFKETNYELIAYFTNKPEVKAGDVLNYNGSGSLTSVGNQAQAHLLGCYAVQESSNSTSSHDINYDKPFEFYWLLSYQFKGKDTTVHLRSYQTFTQKQDVMYTTDNTTEVDYQWRNIMGSY